jgi:hypothetical protein
LYHPDESLIEDFKSKNSCYQSWRFVYNKKGEVLFILETENGIYLRGMKRRGN